MRAVIVRDHRVNPGGESIVEMPGEQLFVVSAAGVTARGAQALQSCWAWFIDRGIWRYGAPGGQPITTTYHLQPLHRAAAEVETLPGETHCYLDPRHFTRGSANGLQAAARAACRRGWTYHAPALAETG